jgi:hypothetical protein
MKYRFAMLMIVAAISLAAQTVNTDVVPAPLPDSSPSDFKSRLRHGMTEAQLQEVMGRPYDQIVKNDNSHRVSAGDAIEVWNWPTQSLVVVLSHKKVAEVWACHGD